MKTTIIGATGFVGSALVKEFATRGHEVTAISRSGSGNEIANVVYVKADIFDTVALTAVLKDSDVVVSAYNPGWSNPNIYSDFLAGSNAIQEAVKQAGVDRYIVIGGAGSLYVAENLQAVDTPDFPKEYHAGASAARDYLNILKEEQGIDWVFFSPAFEMHPGVTTGRTGNYRLGLDNPVFDADNRSILSVEDLAIVIADEAETANHHRQRFTAAY